MKALLLTIALSIFGFWGVAQISEDENGIYYADNNTLYTGTYEEFFDNGNMKFEIPIQEGKKNGIIFYYYEDGTKMEQRSYKNNIMHGTWITWNNKGVKTGEANYQNGIKHGKWFIWDDKGTLRCEMNYHNGEKRGVWKIFGEDGKLESKKDFN